MFASLIFVFGLLSFTVSSNNNTVNENAAKTWMFISKDSVKEGAGFLIPVTLKKSLLTKLDLEIYCEKDERLNIIPVKAYTSESGLIAGTNWKPLNITINKISKDRLQYSVTGIIE